LNQGIRGGSPAAAAEDEVASGAAGPEVNVTGPGDKTSSVVDEEVDRSEIERNANGSEEPHSADPELWNFDGTEVDLADGHKYKMGKQLWYIQDRAKDAIKAGKPVAGQPMNAKAKNSGKDYRKD